MPNRRNGIWEVATSSFILKQFLVQEQDSKQWSKETALQIEKKDFKSLMSFDLISL